MKVLFTLDALGFAGTEKSMLEIISHFSPDVQVTVVYFFPREQLKDDYIKAGAKLHYIPAGGRFPSWSNIRQLKKIIREEKTDVVVSSILRANLVSRAACRLTNTPLIGTFVSDSYSSLRKSSFSVKRNIGFYFYYWLDRLTSGIPKSWISNSESIKSSNCQYLKINPEKVKVIYRGRNSNVFPPKENVLLSGRFRFVYIGRLLETKGLKELVQAFATVVKEFPQATLDIYGKGNYADKLTALINSLGISDHVTEHGVVPDGWKKLYEADCFVFPSWYEGFSGSLVEAMMVGIPIIASDIPMNLEAVKADKNALVYTVRDEKDLAEKMRTAILSYDHLKDMAQLARNEALERFDIKKISGTYEAHIRSIAGK